MKTREQAEARALELYPPSQSITLDIFHSNCRQAYLKGWEEAQDTKLREAAEMVIKKSAWYDLEHISIDFANAVVELEKALK